MNRKIKSVFGVVILVLLLCSIIGVTAFAGKAIFEEDKGAFLTSGAKKASSSDAEQPDEGDLEKPTDEEIIEDEAQNNTTDEEIKEAQSLKNAKIASDSNAEYIPVEGLVWQVGDNGYNGKDYPGWAKWDADQLTNEEWERFRAVIVDVYKDGEYIGGGFHDSDGKVIEADLRYYFKDPGIYTFRATYMMNDNWQAPDDEALWSEFSDAYKYTPPTKKVTTPTGLKWNPDGTVEWKAVPKDPSYDVSQKYIMELYKKNLITGEFECIDRGGREGKTTTDRFVREMKAGATYKFKVVALGNLITYANSEASEFSSEFVMSMTSEEGKELIEDLGTGDVKSNIENANLTSEEKGGLKLAIQADPEVAQNYAALEEAFRGNDIPDLEIGTGESGVDSSQVKVTGGVLNGATGILFEKPTQADLDNAGVTNYRKWSAVNITLEGGSSGELKFPVLITMAVPNGMSAGELTITHVKHDGTIEIIHPRDNQDGTVSFAVTEFSSFVFVDNTPTNGGSTGGSGSSSGGSSSIKADPLETSGVWSQSEQGWQFARLDGKATASQWLMNGGNWYRFDEKSYMLTGWFTDTDGKKFYLNPISDGFKGAMKTGWQMIEGKWYYFNQISDGSKGALLVNTMTPDGYTVNAEGVWAQ